MMSFRPILAAIVLVLAPHSALAQNDERRPFAWGVVRAVLVDPTTFAPGVISYASIRQDWKTSQVLFTHGWLEQNPRFTISGRANDVPVVYHVGIGRIRGVALTVLQYSAINNLSAGIAEACLSHAIRIARRSSEHCHGLSESRSRR